MEFIISLKLYIMEMIIEEFMLDQAYYKIKCF